MSAGAWGGGPCTVVTLAGRVDAAARRELEDVLLAEARKGPRRLVVDLSAVEAMDLVAVAVIVWASRVVNAHGGALVLVSPQPAVAGLLERSGMAPLLPVWEGTSQGPEMPGE